MQIQRTVRLGCRIARGEWTRHRREYGIPLTGNRIWLAVLVGTAIGLGWFAHSIGRAVATGTAFPDDRAGLFTSGAFAYMVWRSSEYTQVRFERLDSEFLLTTVPARTAVVGLFGFVYARLGTVLVGPALGVAVGAAVGFRSLSVAVSILVAVATMAVLAVALGTTLRLAGRLLALRLARGRFYRDVLVVFGWIPLVAGAMLVQNFETGVSVAVVGRLGGSLPVAWFVDLAFAGTGGTVGSGQRAIGALGVLVLSVPVFAGLTTRIVARIWAHTPADSTASRGSHSLLETGLVERLVWSRLPRAVYTVARERWLMERRVPRGLLSAGYPLVVMGLFGFPVVALTGDALTLLVFFAVTLGMVAGTAFAADPIGTEYRALPMVLTSCTGPSFVGGGLLAVAVVGFPLVASIVVPLGIIGPMGPLQTVLTALLGMVVCVCTAAVAFASGLGTARDEYEPTSFFFTDVPIYAEPGTGGIIRYGMIFATVLVVSVPAFVGTSSSVYEPLATAGVPVVLVRTGALVLTIVAGTVVTRIATRTAIQRFRRYQIRN